MIVRIYYFFLKFCSRITVFKLQILLIFYINSMVNLFLLAESVFIWSVLYLNSSCNSDVSDSPGSDSRNIWDLKAENAAGETVRCESTRRPVRTGSGSIQPNRQKRTERNRRDNQRVISSERPGQEDEVFGLTPAVSTGFPDDDPHLQGLSSAHRAPR